MAWGVLAMPVHTLVPAPRWRAGAEERTLETEEAEKFYKDLMQSLTAKTTADPVQPPAAGIEAIFNGLPDDDQGECAT